MAEDQAGAGIPATGPLRELLDELRGLAAGILADRQLADEEIYFLRDWLSRHRDLAAVFPGNVLHQRIRDVLEDGIITGEERDYLIETLTTLIEGGPDEAEDDTQLTELWFDEADRLDFRDRRFCLTGNFVYGPIDTCRTAIMQRGGIVDDEVGPDADYLVVGSLGVDEWRHGGLGRDIEAAMLLRDQGVAVKIIPEQAWAVSL